MVPARKERKMTMSLLDFFGRVLSGTRPEIVTPATAPVISDILVECYLTAAKGNYRTPPNGATEPAIGPFAAENRQPRPNLRYGNRNLA